MSGEYVYRAFDGSGRLLYVGFSTSPWSRIRQHSADSRWFDEVERWDVVRHPAGTARRAEQVAIATERPRYNVAHQQHLRMGADELRDLRHRSGLTQHELAVLVGCSDGMIAAIETNRRQPGDALATRIRRVLIPKAVSA